MGVVFFQLRRETDAGGIFHTLFDAKIAKNDHLFLRDCFPGQTLAWVSAAISGSPGTFYGRNGNTRYIK